MERSCGMGHPQRAAQSSHDDPFVSVGEWLDDEQSAPWCVDTGVAIQVMTTRSVYDAVEDGALSPDTKVWRDGRACWLPIAECYELTVEPPKKEHTPVSRIRRVRPRLVDWSLSPAPEPADPTTDADPERSWNDAPTARPRRSSGKFRARHERPAMMLTTSFVVGVVIGALLYLPFAW